MNLELLTAYVAIKRKNIPGKKAFQKIFYFLTENGIPTGLSYRIYHYGPYSSDLDYKTDDLVMQGSINLLEPQGHSKANHIIPGFDAENMVAKFSDELQSYSEIIDRLLHDLPSDPRTLELWSTTHFMVGSKRRLGEEINKETIIDAVKEIKGAKFSNEEISAAYDRLRETRLVN